MFRLEYVAPKVVFYECLNSILVFQSDGYYYCTCDNFSGCKSYVGYRGYCFICQFSDHFSSVKVETIKYQSRELINFTSEFFNDIKLCYEYDESILRLK